MTTLDKIKLIDFYLHGVDRDLWDFEIPNYDVSLDALRPVIVKITTGFEGNVFDKKIHRMFFNIEYYLIGQHDFNQVFDSVVECIKYLEEKKKNTENV